MSEAADGGISDNGLIALEEAFSIPEIVEASREAAGGVPSMRSGPIAGPFMEDLLDLGSGRVAAMDAAGISMQFLAVAGPGVQHLDSDLAVNLARLANDRLHDYMRQHPNRFAGMVTLAPQAPSAAAAEIQRCIRELGFKGVLINSHTHGRFLSEPDYRPILEAIEDLGVPLYLHPRDPARALAGSAIPGFTVGWAYAVETGTHAIDLIAGGVLDRFPRLKVVLGHLGESIPMLLERIDNRYGFEIGAVGGEPLPRKPSEYFREHFYVTTSGMNFERPLHSVISILGADRVMFAADHPMEDQAAAARDFRNIPLPAAERAAIGRLNAVDLFDLRSGG